MTLNPSICFVIPYYKGLNYLEKALNSLLLQSEPTWVAIVVDDRGGEDAESLVSSFADPRISYFRNEQNLGIGGNWNKCISLATADLVTIFHSDDLLQDNYVEVMSSLMLEYPKAAMGHCKVKIIGDDDQPKISLPDVVKRVIQPKDKDVIVTEGDKGLSTLTRGAWIFCPTICYRRSQLPDRWFDERYQFVLDVDFSARMLLQGKTIVGTSEVAYLYRRHAANQTKLLTDTDQRFSEEIAHLQRVHIWSTEKGWLCTQKSTKRMVSLRLHMIYEALKSIFKTNIKRAISLTLAAVTKDHRYVNKSY